jgi:hypothetical protein
MVPVRIQNQVDREYKDVQDAEWDIKNDEAEEKVKIILAKEFPDYFKKQFMDRYEEGTEMYKKAYDLLESVKGNTTKGEPREIQMSDELYASRVLTG